MAKTKTKRRTSKRAPKRLQKMGNFKTKHVRIAAMMGLATTVFVAFQNFSSPQPQHVMVNLLSEIKAAKSLPIFTNTGHKSGACSLLFGEAAKIEQIPGAQTKDEFMNNDWALANWVEKSSFPNFCSTKSQLNSQDGLVLNATDYTFGIHSDHISMGIHSKEFWSRLFGNEFYPTESSQKKFGLTNTFLRKKILDANQLALSEMSNLKLNFDAALVKADINRDTIKTKTRAPEGARKTYDHETHNSQFRLSFVLQWRLTPEQSLNCRGSEEAYCKFNKRYMEYVINIHDDIHEFEISPAMVDPRTKSFVYRENMANLMTDSQRAVWFETKKKNPFKIKNNRIALNSDVLPLLKKVLAKYAGKALPPKLAGETDETYLNHIYIASINMGYEVGGLSDMMFNIYDLSLVATPKIPETQIIAMTQESSDQ